MENPRLAVWPVLSAGHMLTPSATVETDGVPVTAAMVAAQSITAKGCENSVPPGSSSGQRTKAGARIPPSNGVPLPPRKGSLLAPPVFSFPPLSLMKTKSVSLATPWVSSAA